MIHIYYHIYAIDGVESIINEQLSLIKKHFNFPYILNVGISIANKNEPISHILKMFQNIRDIRAMGNEFTTLDLIENDKHKFGDSDYILYIHTKGASKLKSNNYNNIMSWRQIMNYFCIENIKFLFQIFEKTSYNTYGILLMKNAFYAGNFWWAKASYIKTIDLENSEYEWNHNKDNRYNAEGNYLRFGKNWKPYSAYDIPNVTNHYLVNFDRKEYAK